MLASQHGQEETGCSWELTGQSSGNVELQGQGETLSQGSKAESNVFLYCPRLAT